MNKLPDIKLECETEVRVRFNEVDALKIVWHGHYVNYFEDGRQAFGAKFKLGYLDVFKEGFTTPIVEFNCQHKAPLTFGDVAIVKTTFIDSPAAKIIFDYQITKGDNILVAKGRSVQVFLNAKTQELELYQPEFFIDWKKNNGLSR